MERMKALIEQQLPQIIEMRRYFHTYPELSGQEFNTQRKIIAELENLGLEPRMAAGTGVIADIAGEGKGRMIAVRADMDALPVQDELDKPYRSQNHGVCHSCGHDGHIAMVLGLARILSTLKSELQGTVRLIFQPSEERFPGGAVAMVEEGALKGVSAIIGGHLWQPIPVGTIGLTSGRLMASPDEFVITIRGKGGHGSMPHQTVDALLTGAQLVAALNTIISRNVNPMEPAALSIGMFKAGEVFNIIPDTAVLKGTVRSFDQSLRASIFDRIETITQGICLSAGAEYRLDRRYGFPPVVNHQQIAQVLGEAARETLGEHGVIEPEPVMVGEDFSVYLGEIPGCFAFIGCGNEETGIVYPHHHPRFDLDERALGYGTELFCRAAVRLLDEKYVVQ
jgi:amidohydrolase